MIDGGCEEGWVRRGLGRDSEDQDEIEKKK